MGKLLLDSYVKDLDSPAPQSRVRAATELGNMGVEARSALPKLQKLVGDKDAAVSTAAERAIRLIKQAKTPTKPRT
jgi:HEAT repeat protein